jgi:hypothetical protein
MSTLRGTGRDGAGYLALEDEVDRQYRDGSDEDAAGEGGDVIRVLAPQRDDPDYARWWTVWTTS